MEPRHRHILIAAAIALVLALGAHLKAALVPVNLTQVTPNDLVSALLGPGIDPNLIANITYKGATISAGKFSGGTNIIGFEDGVVLSTGNIATVVGPNNSGSATTNLGTLLVPPVPAGAPGDADLTTLSGFQTFDATVLEFDFVPDKDRVFIQYVFASEEYNEFVNRRIGGKLFNDVFAFYINGVNCATVGGLPVTIQTVNDGGPTLGTPPISHPELYINNDVNLPAAQKRDTQMDGLTKVLTCQGAVQPHATNHIKLAIADSSDANLDSNVFLRSASFTTTTPLTIIKRTNKTDNDVEPAPLIAAGGPVEWSYVVTNAGADTLDSVAVTDDKLGPITCPAQTLAAGGSFTCTATGVAVPGSYTNLGTVVGTSPIIGPITDSNPDRYFGAQPRVQIVTKTNHTDNDVAPGPSVLVGSPVLWTYEVSNTGNVDLHDVSVHDSSGAAVDCSIAPGQPQKTSVLIGETMVCAATGTGIAGQYENTGSVSASIQVLGVDGSFSPLTVTASNLDHYFGADPKLAIVKKTDGTDNDTAPGPLVLVGDPVSWTYEVTNTGNVALSDVAVTDDREGAVCTIGALAVGQTAPACTKTGVAQKGAYQNTATTSGAFGPVTSADGSSGTATVSAANVDHYFGADPKVGVVKKTNGTDNDAAPGPFILVGDPVTWTYTVTNTGNVALTNLTVTDDKENAVCTIATLAVGETAAPCSKGSTAKSGNYANTGTVSTTLTTVTANGQTKSTAVSGSNIDHYFGADPRLMLTKKTNGTDNNSTPGRLVLVGDSIEWTYNVTNTGNVPLTNIAVTDDKEGAICTIATLAPGATATACSKTSTASKDQYTNTGTASTTFVLLGPNGQTRTAPVTSSDADNYFGADPQVKIVKTTNGIDSDTAPGALVLAGSPVTWTYIVTNTGNVALTNVTVTDDKQGFICTIATLPVGTAATQCARSATAQRGQYVNVGTASAQFDVPTSDNQPRTVPVTSSNVDYYFGADPKLTMVKTTDGTDNDVPPGRSVLVGDPVVFGYAVTNAGNVPLADVRVTDDREGAICTIAALAVGETSTACTKTATAVKGQYTNIGTAATMILTIGADGQPRSTAVSASNVDNYFGADPHLGIIKKTNGTDNDTAPGRFVLTGDPVVWTYTVSNTGNVALTNVTVTDDKQGTICTIASLAVGATAPDCASSGIAQAGPYANTGTAATLFDIATADGRPRSVPVTSSNVDYYFGANPRISIIKRTNGTDNDLAPGPAILAGSPVTWTYDVTNTGNVPLANVTVTDDRQGAVCTIASVAAGQTTQCTKSALATPGPYANTGTASGGVDVVRSTGQTATIVVSSSNVDHYFGADPHLTIVKKTVTFRCVPSGDDHKSHDDGGNYGKSSSGFDGRYTSSGSGDGGGADKGHDDDYSDKGCGSGSGHDTDKGYGGDQDHSDKNWSKGHESDGGYSDGQSHGELKRVETDNNAAPGPFVTVGSAIGWTYTVTNTGNVPLANIVVTDDKEGAICTIAFLAPGQSAPPCTKTGTAKVGQYENLGTAATNYGPVFVGGLVAQTVPVSGTDVDHYFGAQPDIQIIKKTNGTDNKTAPGPVIQKGHLVTWTYIVSNAGNLPLTNVKLVDDQIGVITCPATTLAVSPDPASTMTCTASGNAIGGQYKNIGTVTGSSPFGPVTASDQEYYWGLDTKTYQGPGCR